MDPTDKVALVTGGAGGIGLAICEELLRQKVKGVSVCDVNSEVGAQTVAELRDKYGANKVIFIKTDVRDILQLEAAFKETKERFGALHIVVNNAGIFDDCNWEMEVDINLNGVIRGLQLAFKHMGKSSGGTEAVVVNIASITGLEPIDIIPIYSAIKHGVVGLTRAFGTELHFSRTGVRVVGMCPGFTNTSIGPRPGTLIDQSCEKQIVEQFKQSTDYVGRGVLHIIREAQNGSLWVSEMEEDYYPVSIPPRLAMRTSANTAT